MSSFTRLTCSICLDWLDNSATIASAECGHIFHEECIRKALRRSQRCPSCRRKTDATKLRPNYFSTAEFHAQEELEIAYRTIARLEKENKELRSNQINGAGPRRPKNSGVVGHGARTLASRTFASRHISYDSGDEFSTAEFEQAMNELTIRGNQVHRAGSERPHNSRIVGDRTLASRTFTARSSRTMASRHISDSDNEFSTAEF